MRAELAHRLAAGNQIYLGRPITATTTSYRRTTPRNLLGPRLSLEPKRTLRNFAQEKFLRFVRITQRPKFALEDGFSDREVVPALNIDVLVA